MADTGDDSAASQFGGSGPLFSLESRGNSSDYALYFLAVEHLVIKCTFLVSWFQQILGIEDQPHIFALITSQITPMV